MRIKDALKRDFGIDIRISGGEGTRADPFTFDTPLSASEAGWNQWQLLRGLGKGRRELWRLREVFDVPNEPSVQGLRIDTIAFREGEIVSETRSYYFDLAGVQGPRNGLIEQIIWADRRAAMIVPFQVGWLHFDEAIENADRPEDLNVSLLFSAAGAKAILYVYHVKDAAKSETSPAALRAKELDTACQEIRTMHADATPIWEQGERGAFVLQYFRLGAELTLVGVAVAGEFIVKLRLTHLDDPKMLNLMYLSVTSFADLVPHEPTAKKTSPMMEVFAVSLRQTAEDTGKARFLELAEEAEKYLADAKSPSSEVAVERGGAPAVEIKADAVQQPATAILAPPVPPPQPYRDVFSEALTPDVLEKIRTTARRERIVKIALVALIVAVLLWFLPSGLQFPECVDCEWNAR